MTNLSPTARAVRKAYYSTDDDLIGPVLAAVLRAAADEVAPEAPESEQDDPDMLKGIWSERRTIREELLAIADELDAQ